MDAKTIISGINQTKTFEKEHLSLGLAMLSADNGTLFSLDLLAVGALNRSYSQCVGFRKLIYLRNFICACSLVRLQLDNALRFYAAWLVDNPHDFADKVFNGMPVKKHKDKKGKFLTDKYLVDSISSEYPWIKNVYKQSSGYIHLSEKHIFNGFRSVDNTTNVIDMVITSNQKFIPQHLFVETINAFNASTEIFLRYIRGWSISKEHPELLQRS